MHDNDTHIMEYHGNILEMPTDKAKYRLTSA